MLEGITVLNTSMCMPRGSGGILVFLTIIASCAIIGLIYSLKYCKKAKKIIACIVSIMIAAGCIFGIFAIANMDQATYKVIVDDTVSFTEFNNRYKIIDQEGLIFTIIER